MSSERLRRIGRAAVAPGALARAVALLLGATILVLACSRAAGPFFENMAKAGFHDWDSAGAYRYITVLSLKRFHQPPWWHPYLCGGFPGWAYAEGASTFASPYLPFYLGMPIFKALRVEILGSLLVSLVGTYALTARFTKSIAVRVLVAALYTINGRWALQVTAGHAWHLQYAWSPVALLFFDMACERGRMRWAIGSGVALAVMVYSGGIYPVPQTALLLACWALGRLAMDRSFRPIGALCIAGFSSIGLAAPKLLPIIDLMNRYTRKIESTEAIGLNELGSMLAAPNQSFHRGTAPVPAYGWHEWGMYIGAPMLVLLLLAIMYARGKRATPLKLVGLFFVVLSLGAFAEKAPWTLLHKLPVFSSQHVPSRFLFLGFLFLSLSLAAWAGQLLDRPLSRWPWLDVLLLIPVWWVVSDVAEVSRKTTVDAFTLDPPKVTFRPEFQQLQYLPYDYSPAGAWAGPSLPAMMANDGFLACYSVPDRAEPHGAIAKSDPRYKGEAYIDGPGRAWITSWSPNQAEIAYEGATPGSTLVYNMNYEVSWRANGQLALDHEHAVAARIDRPAGTVKMTYFPRMLPAGLVVFFFTLTACIFAPKVTRLLASRLPLGRRSV